MMLNKEEKIIEQVVILAGGSSSRMWPFTGDRHKVELVILGQSIIFHTLDNLRKNGVKEIIVVVGGKNNNLKKLIKEYEEEKHCKIKVVVQEKPLGMAHAILCAKKYLKDEFFVINANHFDSAFLMKQMLDFNAEIVLSCSETETPWLYGMAKIVKGRVRKIEEKPTIIDPTAKKILGIFRLSDSFVKFLNNYPLSNYSFEEAMNAYAKDHVIKACEVSDEVNNSLKYPWHLLSMKDKLLDQMEMTVGENVTISPHAVIKGKVKIDDGALIGDFALLEGPVYVGKNAIVGRFSTVRGYSSIEENAQIQSYGEVRGSIFMPESTMHSGFVGDSVIGEQSKIGANITTANVRLDRRSIAVYRNGEKINTKLKRLGVMMGHNCKVGISVNTMPGIMIGSNQNVVAASTLERNIE